MTDYIRQAFEKWLIDNMTNEQEYLQVNGNEYSDHTTQSMWEGYKAAIASLEQNKTNLKLEREYNERHSGKAPDDISL